VPGLWVWIQVQACNFWYDSSPPSSDGYVCNRKSKLAVHDGVPWLSQLVFRGSYLVARAATLTLFVITVLQLLHLISVVVLCMLTAGLVHQSLVINCRLGYFLTSICAVIQTLPHCCLTVNLWMSSWSCLRSRYWSAGSTTIFHGRHANGRCPTSHLTSRIPLSIFIFWIRLLRAMLELPLRLCMYVYWLLNWLNFTCLAVFWMWLLCRYTCDTEMIRDGITMNTIVTIIYTFSLTVLHCVSKKVLICLLNIY